MKYTVRKIFFVNLISVTLHYVIADSLSYRSSIIENGKPILRSAVEDKDKTTTNYTIQYYKAEEQQWVKELRTKIEQHVKDYGYKNAKPFIEKLVDETENSQNLLLYVKVARNGTSVVEYSPILRSKKRRKEKLRFENEEPQWLTEFKSFIKMLVQTYSREKTKEKLQYFINAVQKQHGVHIKDIDIDPYGNAIVSYDNVNKKSKKKKGLRKETPADSD